MTSTTNFWLKFFEGCSWFKSNNVGLTLGKPSNFSLAKGLKLKGWKFWGLIATVVEVTGGKLIDGTPFLYAEQD